MSKKHLLPQENEEFLERLGLTEVDIKVYIATLDGGLVSLGEIQQLTEINDLGRILESVRDLIDVGLVKKAQGTMRRYYATLPFFRETLSVEREFKFALEAMIQSLNQSKEKTTQNRERIVAMRFPSIVDNLLDQYYQEILAPVISDLESLQDEVKSQMMPFIREVDAENASLKEEINLMLKPVSEYSKLLNQKFQLGISGEHGKLNEYLANRKQNRLMALQKAHKAIGSHLEKLSKALKNLVGELRSMHTALREEVDKVGTTATSIKEHATQFQSSAQEIDNAKKELQAELVVAREQVKKAATEVDPTERIDEIFANLTEKIKLVNFSSDNLISSLQEAQSSISSSHQSLDQTVSALDQTIPVIDTKLTNLFDELKSEMSEIFNELNDRDEEQLTQLKDSIEEKLQTLETSIKEEGSSVQSKLDDHIKTISKQQEDTLQRYQDKMLSFFDRPAKISAQFLDTWLDTIEPIIEEFKAKSDEALIDILEPIQELEDGTFSTLTERIGFVRTMIEGRSNDLQQVLEFAKNFDFTKSADTSVVVGLPAMYASLTDLLLRTKSKVTVVTPHLDLELMEVARTLKSTVRITFVTDIDPDKDARLIKKVEDLGRITLRNYPDRDLYACIRDSEEIIFGYIKEGEETIGIRSSTPSIVELLMDRLNETVIRNSKLI